MPVAADRNAEDLGVVQAAIAAGLWPKVVCLAKEGTYVQMKTLGNSQVVAFHPTSVNFQRPPRDFAVNFLAYFTLMCVTRRHNISNANRMPQRFSGSQGGSTHGRQERFMTCPLRFSVVTAITRLLQKP